MLSPKEGLYVIEKGQKIKLRVNNVSDPDGTVTNVGIRYKLTSEPACAKPDDPNALGPTIKDGTTGSWTYEWDTKDIAVGEYSVWANPKDDRGNLCSGNPFSSSANNYCEAGIACQNCKTIVRIVAGCSRKPEGDANCDGKIDGIDYSIWLNHQCNPGNGQSCTDFRPDFNSDRKINDEDLNIWKSKRGT